MSNDDIILMLGPVTQTGGGSLYGQIIAALRREIAAKRLTPGQILPSVRALAEGLLVSVITVKRAYEDLEREGLLLTRQGLGTFVAPDAQRHAFSQSCNEMRAAMSASVQAGRAAGLTLQELHGALDEIWQFGSEMRNGE